MKQSRFRRVSLTRLGHEIRKMEILNTVLAIQDLMHPRPQREHKLCLISYQSVVVSEHFMLKEILRMRDTNKNTVVWLCQTRAVFTESHMMASNLLSNTYPFILFPSFKQGHWVALKKWSFKESGKYHLWKMCYLPSAIPRESY